MTISQAATLTLNSQRQVTGNVEGTVTVNGALTTEQTIVEVTGSAGVLASIAIANDTFSGANKTFRVYIDGTVAILKTFSNGSGSSNLSDLLADSTELRRAFLSGLWFKSSMKITFQLDSAGGSGSAPQVSYKAWKVTT